MLEEVKRIKEYLLPVRILAAESAENAERLLRDFEDQIHIHGNECCTLKSGGHLILDYGKELHGGIRIITESGADGNEPSIRIRFGESVGECCAELGESGACNDHSPRDFKVCIPRLSDLDFGETGFRFVRIDNISGTDYKFTATAAVYIHIDEKFKGKFRCNDEELNLIYDTAAYTLFLNMQNRLWDGIKRDRLVWVGDMHPEVKGILNLFGAHPLVEKGLAESAAHYPVPNWITGLPSYSVWWLAIMCDYEWYTGRWEFVRSQLDYFYAVLDLLNRSVGDDGEIAFPGVHPEANPLFLNWETYSEEGLPSGMRGLILWTVRKCAAMLSRRGLDCSVALKIAEKLQKKSIFEGKSKAVAALYSLGYKPGAAAEKLLVTGGAEGFSTFLSSYICNALFELGRGEEAVKAMKEFYNGMLSRGATSFWESYEPYWLVGSGRIDEFTKNGEKDIHCSFGKFCYNGYRLSLCHGWACGPVPFLTERVLGVEFTAVGGEKVKIKPALMGLNYAEGAVPTAYGVIEVSHKKVGSEIKTEYSLPAGVTLDK